MAKFDKAMEQRVWQRVQGNQSETGIPKQQDLDLQRLMMSEWMAAAAYLQLSRQMPPKEAAILQRIFREEQTHAAILKGMYVLISGERPVIRTPRSDKEPVDTALRKCYAGELRSIADYEARAGHPEYGHVFASMAKQEREHSRTVLELLGQLDKK